ncbi:DUF3019 domain-containing protein [Gammaproteobacteria bacterium LSUCC0112]|nr:DUF3019 domain-containing protein [Gammaproteobacteria bacterium LSUCC0112]
MLKIVTEFRRLSDTAFSAVGLSMAGRLIGVLLLWMGAPALFQATTPGQEVTLHAQPRICVVPADKQRCSLQLKVAWTSATPRHVCLQLHGQSATLQCWQAQQSGDFSMMLAQTENILIQLLDAQTLEVLSDIDIPVIKRDLRDTRRRRRHAWSVF